MDKSQAGDQKNISRADLSADEVELITAFRQIQDADLQKILMGTVENFSSFCVQHY